jgi:hypothetical protein
MSTAVLDAMCSNSARLIPGKPRKKVMKLVLTILLMFSGYTFAASCTLTNERTATPSKVAPAAKHQQ